MSLASRLQKAVAELKQPYGFERSFKLKQDNLLQERFLLSLHRTAFGQDLLAGLHQFIKPFHFPESSQIDLKALTSKADIIHLGYEKGGRRELLKIYFEFVSEVKATLKVTSKSTAQVPVYIAYKWDLKEPETEVIKTNYHFQPGSDRGKIMDKITFFYGGNKSVPWQITQSLVKKSAETIPDDELFMLEVSEENNPRTSFDLKFYDTEWTLGSLRSDLIDLFNYFNLSPAALDGILQLHRDKMLGHISGGIGRDGNEFVTIYYGVEGR